MTDTFNYLENYGRGFRDGEASLDAEVAEFHRQIESQRREIDEQCRLNGMGAEREAALVSKIEQQQREVERLKKRTMEAE